MSFCRKCGAYIADNSNFCPACGARAGDTADPWEESNKTREKEPWEKKDAEYGSGSASRQSYASQNGANSSQSRTDYSDSRAYTQKNETNKEYNTPNNTAKPLIQSDKIAVLCYFGLLFLIPYFTSDSEFVRFHCNQGLLLLLADVIVGIVSSIFVVGWLVGLVGGIFTVICFFKGISNVLNGKMAQLPVIGKYQLLKK